MDRFCVSNVIVVFIMTRHKKNVFKQYFKTVQKWQSLTESVYTVT